MQTEGMTKAAKLQPRMSITHAEPIEAAPRYYGRSLERQRVLPGQIIAVANIARLFFVMQENLEGLVLIVQPQ